MALPKNVAVLDPLASGSSQCHFYAQFLGWTSHAILSHQISHKISPLLVILDGHPFIKAFIPIIISLSFISYKMDIQSLYTIIIYTYIYNHVLYTWWQIYTIIHHYSYHPKETQNESQNVMVLHYSIRMYTAIISMIPSPQHSPHHSTIFPSDGLQDTSKPLHGSLEAPGALRHRHQLPRDLLRQVPQAFHVGSVEVLGDLRSHGIYGVCYGILHG